MPKSLFIDNEELEQVDLGDGFWVKIPKEISYKKSEKLFEGMKIDKNNPIGAGKKMMSKLIEEWNLTEEDGKIAEINEKNIERLPLKIVNLVSTKLDRKMSIDKKKLPTSKEQSKATS